MSFNPPLSPCQSQYPQLWHIFGKIIITLLRPNLRILYVLPTPLHIANPPPAICNYRPESVY